jgi:hypothetical protein
MTEGNNPTTDRNKLSTKRHILTFLHIKIKNKDQDPEQKWVTTYNDNLHRIKHS